MSDFDAAINLLGGGQQGAAATSGPSGQTFSPSGSYGTPAAILDGLMQTESSGDPYAVHKQSKAMGAYQFTPDTVAYLHKRGVKFDPFDPAQARAAADWYISDLKAKNGGDTDKALAAYGGFSTKDPSAYQAKVAGNPQQSSQQQAPQGDFDAAISLLNPPKTKAAPQSSPTTTSTATNPGGGRGFAPASAYPGSPSFSGGAHTNPAKPSANPWGAEPGTDPYGALVMNQLTGFGSSIVGGWKGLATLAAGGSVSQATDAVTKYQQEHTYQPEADTRSGSFVKGFGSGWNPLNWLGLAGNWAGEKTTDLTGSPATGAAVSTAINAVPYALGWRGRNAPVQPVASMSPVDAASARAAASPRAQPVRVEPTLEGEPSPTTQQPQAPVQAPQQSRPSPPQGTQGTPAQAAPTQQPQAPVQAIPSRPITLQPSQQTRPVFSDIEDAPSIPSGATVLPRDVQSQRAQVLSDIGLNDARESAITGDAKAAATDYQMSKLDGPAGNHMRNVLDSERQALEGYAENVVRSTGGTSGLDQGALYARGNTILAPLDSLRQWFDQRTGELYREADARAQGVPTQLSGFRSVLSDDSMLTNSDRVHLRDGLNSYVGKLGISGDDGTISGNAQQAETIRKYLNENWTPANSRYVGALKDALDDDVTKAAGDDVYAQARAMRSLRGRTLDNPNGIAKLVDADGINRAVPVEKIPDAVAGMPVDQLRHVVETLQGVPDELRPQADAALAEIRSHFANNVAATGNKFAGQWNARGVNKYLQANGEKMGLVMQPEQIRALDTLNQAGHILGKDQSYPGAAAQGHNLLRSGAMGAIQSGSTAAGAALGGPIGASIGGFVGSKAAQAVGDRAALSSARGRIKRLSDFVNPPAGSGSK